MIKDGVGTGIVVGSKVVYCTRTGSHTYMNVGVVLSVTGEPRIRVEVTQQTGYGKLPRVVTVRQPRNLIVV